MTDLSKTNEEAYYAIEYWTDEYNTLGQSIKYLCNNNDSYFHAIRLLNPHMTKLKSITYYNIKNEVINVDKYDE